MSRDISADMQRIKLFQTEPHACSYLPGRDSTTAFVDPEMSVDPEIYERLSMVGFRRSGSYLYTPMCTACRACVPARLPVAQFRPTRAQKRCLKRNVDLKVAQCDSIDLEKHYPLYAKYISERHAGGDMSPPTKLQFEQFLGEAWECTQYLEFYLDDELIGCAVVDVLPDSLSAIYTYFDPAHDRRGLGNLAVLLQIQMAARMDKRYVYLGYWIEDCQKMNYKKQYQPIELLQENSWQLSE
jgi:arginyl-tRNA--protein-N-Asp/Glu arginylyltransferase